MKNFKAFTLIEIVIVTLIVGILAGVLFKTYVTVSQISFRVEQQKIINQELLFVSETLQNFSNKNQINHEKYKDLDITFGLTNTLYLSGEDGDFSIFSSGNCVGIDQEPSIDHLDDGCSLVLQKDGKAVYLTNPGVYISQVWFKIIPFYSAEEYFQNPSLCDTNYLSCIHDTGFWFLAKLYSKGYNSYNWTNNVYLLVQQFFNI